MDFGLITGGLLKATLPKVAGAIATAVKDKLHPTELQRSLEVGLRESGAFDRGQKVNNAVFYRCTDKDADTFLAALLEHPDVQRELQKPLEQDGAPDVAILVQVAKQIAADRTLDISDDTLEPWLKTFANAYFDAITAIRFQVAKANYLEQLANWFDDVKFAGVAVPGQDVERAERLAQIFVMPDVEEEARRGWSGVELRGWGDEGVTDDRQFQLLHEQRLRSQLERSGRKFSARQLLNQHQKKVVLLGAPGSGKTTLMSFFAVEIAERQGAIAPTKDASTEGLQPHAMASSGDTKGLSPNTMALSGGTKGLFADAKGLSDEAIALRPNTMALSGGTMALSGDTKELLPILIRIRDWARTPDVTIPEYARQFAETTMSCKPLPKGFFEHWLNNGRSLILLDGLDEVAEEAKRYHLVQCIENFLGQYPQNRAIITSRPAGYKRDFFRTEEFPHYELQPFDDKKIEEFCDRWYRSRVPDTAEALRRKESLQKALNQQDRIKLLARNPLLLTIIALIHRYQARLPRERYKLYDKAVETLLTSWDDNKELSNQTVLQYLQLDDLRRLMESLAYWIHTHGNTGDREGGTLIDKDELIQKLCQEIKTLKQLQHYEAKAEAERFVKFIRDRTGLLNEQGQDCYAFVHKTFQEYLAAQDINYQADNEDDFEIVLTHIEQHLHDPHWREVLLLLIAQQSPKKAARAIRKVLTANSPYEQWLHRDVLFAGRCLAEDLKGLQVADAALINEILNGLVALELTNAAKIGNKVCNEVFQLLCSMQESAFEADALQLLQRNADCINEYRLQGYQVALGDTEAAITEILIKIKNEASGRFSTLSFGKPDSCARRRALRVHPFGAYHLFNKRTLSSFGNSSNVVLPAILVSLQDENSFVRANAACLLSAFENSSNAVLQALLNLLQDENSDVRANAAFTLSAFENSSNAVLQALLSLLQDENSDVRANAAFTLSAFENSSNAVLQALLSLLQDENSDVRINAIAALSNFGNSSNAVLQALLNLLQDENSYVRASTASALVKLGSVSDSVLQALFALLQDESSDVRSIAADALVKLGSVSDTVPKVLFALLQSEFYNVRSSAADALIKLGIASDEVLHVLLASLQDAEVDVRLSAIKALIKLGNASDIIRHGLFALLQQEVEIWVRPRAAETLGKLAKRSNQVEPAIVQWIEQHQDEECVGAGIDALWEIVEGEG